MNDGAELMPNNKSASFSSHRLGVFVRYFEKFNMGQHVVSVRTNRFGNRNVNYVERIQSIHTHDTVVYSRKDVKSHEIREIWKKEIHQGNHDRLQNAKRNQKF